MPTLEELEADAQQRSLEAIYGPTPQDRERIGFPNFGYPGQPGYERQAEPAPQQPPVQSFRRQGPGYPGDWLPGLTGLGRMAPPVPAPQIPATLGLAPPARQPDPGDYQYPVEPRLAMPTQETHTPEPPLVLDERVNPPTPTEQQGLEGSMVGTMGNDPIALMGYGREVTRWGEPPINANVSVLGQYMHPRNRTNRAEGVADTIRFQPGLRASPPAAGSRYTGPESRIFDVRGDPTLPEIGRHEFRHRGFHNLDALARAYGISIDSNRVPADYRGELMNIFADRELGSTVGYQDTQFSPGLARMRREDLNYLREIADRINAARVQQMHDAGVSWTQTGRTME